MSKSYITVTLEEDVDIDDFPAEIILEAAERLGGSTAGKALADAAYIAITTGKPDDERTSCRKLVEHITGRIL